MRGPRNGGHDSAPGHDQPTEPGATLGRHVRGVAWRGDVGGRYVDDSAERHGRGRADRLDRGLRLPTHVGLRGGVDDRIKHERRGQSRHYGRQDRDCDWIVVDRERDRQGLHRPGLRHDVEPSAELHLPARSGHRHADRSEHHDGDSRRGVGGCFCSIAERHARCRVGFAKRSSGSGIRFDADGIPWTGDNLSGARWPLPRRQRLPLPPLAL